MKRVLVFFLLMTSLALADVPAIDNLYLMNSNGTYALGDTIHVTMTGTPGGMATFEIKGVAGGVYMPEISPGRYEGTLKVQPGMQARGGRLVGHLQLGGTTADVTSRSLLTVDAPPAPVTQGAPMSGDAAQKMFLAVSTPLPGQAVGANFLVSGQTLPGAQVNVRASLLQPQLTPGLSQTASAGGVADATGHFSITLHWSGLGKPGSVSLHVDATAGGVSSQVDYGIATSP